MQQSKANILFTSTFTTSFIKSDLQSLEKNYTVFPVIGSGYKTPFKYLKLIGSVDITFSWFASVYSSVLIFFTKIFKKKSILILGGVDVAKEKEFGYGIWNSPWKSLLVKYAITNADNVLAVDDSLKIKAMELCRYSGENIKILPTGFDPGYWKPGGEKNNTVLTVANCPDAARLKIKGIDFLIQIAKAAKDFKFIVVGVADYLLSRLDIPQNMKSVSFLSQSQLLIEYQKSKVYLQPSYMEGLPNALCEAMLCECYPVGTNVGGIPAAIGDTGRIIKYGSIEQGCLALTEAITNGDGKSARLRIASRFSKEKREKELNSLIESLSK